MRAIRFPGVHARNIFSLILSLVLMMTMGACLKANKQTGVNAVAAAPEAPTVSTVESSIPESEDAEGIAVAEKCEDDDEAEVEDEDEDEDETEDEADDDADEEDDDDKAVLKNKEAKAKEKKECKVAPADSTEKT